MEDLIVEYEGVKGKGLKTLGIKGRVVMTTGSNTITVDNFKVLETIIDRGKHLVSSSRKRRSKRVYIF